MKVRVTLRDSGDRDITADGSISIAVDPNTNALNLYDDNAVRVIAVFNAGTWLTAEVVAES